MLRIALLATVLVLQAGRVTFAIRDVTLIDGTGASALPWKGEQLTYWVLALRIRASSSFCAL